MGAGDGLLVEPGDVTALGEAMVGLHDNVASYHAANIRRRCEARFSEAALVATLGEVYAEAIAGGGVR